MLGFGVIRILSGYLKQPKYFALLLAPTILIIFSYPSQVTGTDIEFTENISSYLAVRPIWMTKFVSNDHFEIWYTDDAVNYPDHAITQAEALRLLDYFEMARDILVVQWGYPEPASAGNPRYEVWVQYLAPPNNGSCFDMAAGDPVNTSKIRINSKLANQSYGDLSLLLSIAAHEYHHATEQAFIHMGSGAEVLPKIWLVEFSSSWAGYMVRRLHPEIPGDGAWNYLKDRLNFFTGQSYRGLKDTSEAGLDVKDYHDACTFAYFLTENTIVNFAGTGRPSREVIKDFWEAMRSFGDWDHVPEAFSRALTNAPEGYRTFEDALVTFSLALYLNGRAFPVSDTVTPDLSFNSTDIDAPDDASMDIDLDAVTLPLQLVSATDADPRAIGPMGAYYLDIDPGTAGRVIGFSFHGEPATRFAVSILGLRNGTGCTEERVILDPANNGYDLISLNPANMESGVVAIVRLDESGTGTYEIELSDQGTFEPSPAPSACDFWTVPQQYAVGGGHRHGGCLSVSNDESDGGVWICVLLLFLPWIAARRIISLRRIDPRN